MPGADALGLDVVHVGRERRGAMGRRPECATCIENGHECLGYPDVVEGRTDSKVGAIRNGGEDIEEYEDEKSATLPTQAHSGDGSFPHGSRKRQISLASYSSNASVKAEGGTERNMRGEYRETAVFSDEETSPMGMRSLPGRLNRN